MQSENTLTLSAGRVNWIILVVLALYPLVGMGVDLLAPSLPAISSSLQASAGVAKSLIAIYLLGYAVGSFCLGLLSDALGRRKILLAAFVVFILASLLPTVFANVVMLLVARFLQGLAIAGFAVIARAVLSDVLPPEKLLKTATFVATMWGIGPIIGPAIGGYLQYYFDWQAGFYFFALMGLIGFLAIAFIIPETHRNRQPLNFSQIKINFSTIIKHRLFMGAVILMGIVYSLLIVFNTLGPFLIQTGLGKTPVYFGHLALCMGVAFLIGTVTCRRLIKKRSPEKILSVAVPLLFIIALIGLCFGYVYSQNIWAIVIPTALLFLGAGIVYPSSMGRGMALFRHLAGSGAAVMNLVNILTTSITAFAMGFLNVENMIPLAWVYVVLMLLSVVVFWFLVRHKEG